MYKSLLALAALVAASLHCSIAAADADRVQILPGLRYQPSFRHYSGYLKGGADRHLHYWLVESSRANPTKAPLVLWFNGGPGCSSMEGFLREHGPFIVNDQAFLDSNPYAWNLDANVLYIEAPAGVGFSYSDSGVTKTNDMQTAEDNYLALKDFMRKFPEFESRDLHISGESYAGIYVPTLAARVLQDSSLKLKGIIIGNGVASERTIILSRLYLGYYHGQLGDQLWSDLHSFCCDAKTSGDRCDFYEGKDKSKCKKLLSQAEKEVRDGVNNYNLYQPCHRGSETESLAQPIRGLMTTFRFQAVEPRRSVSKMYLARKFLFGESVADGDELVRLGDQGLPCINNTAISTYLDMPVVRQALNVRNNLPPYSVCVDIDYTNIYKDMTTVYQQLIKSKLPITLYNGDVDTVCSFLQTDWFLQGLNMTVKVPKKAWYFQHPVEGRQIGGYVQQFTSGVTFLTVRGSGHMVPEDKPAQALQLFTNYLSKAEW